MPQAVVEIGEAAEVMRDAFMERARRPGRPKSAAPEVEVKIRLDAKVVEDLRETGRGWQTRVNAELAKAVKQRRLEVAHQCSSGDV